MVAPTSCPCKARPSAHLNPLVVCARQFDCSRLKSWPRAVRACEVTQAYARGEATLADWQALSRNERTALFAFFTAGNRSKQLHFHNVRTGSLSTPTLHPLFSAPCCARLHVARRLHD